MKASLIITLLSSFILLSCSHTATEQNSGFISGSYAVGMNSIRFKDNARKRNLEGRIWYPASPGTEQKQLTHNNIFLGQQAKLEAPSADVSGGFPLLLFSHGSGGNHANLAWLAEMLASYGYIVASIDHPKDTFGDQTSAGIIMKWERPRDLSFLLDQLLADPRYSSRIDLARVGVLGHSSGGYTAVALAGGRYDIERLSSYCVGLNYSSDCSLVTAEQVAQIDSSSSGLSYRDDRFNLFIAFVPAVVQGFSHESLAHIDSPFFIIGARDDSIASFENNAAHYARGIPSARFDILDRGGHFGFFSHCNFIGQQNAAMVCVDAPGIDREKLHRRIQDSTLLFLEEHWSP